MDQSELYFQPEDTDILSQIKKLEPTFGGNKKIIVILQHTKDLDYAE